MSRARDSWTATRNAHAAAAPGGWIGSDRPQGFAGYGPLGLGVTATFGGAGYAPAGTAV